MQKSILALLIACLPCWAGAQNEILLSSSDSLQLSKDYNQLLPAALRKEIDVNVLLRGSLDAFARVHLGIEVVAFHYIFVHGDTYSDGAYTAKKSSEQDNAAWYEGIKTAFFKNKKLYPKMYDALMPLYRSLFEKMTPNEQTAYLDFFKGGLDYAQNFVLANEKADLVRLNDEFAHTKGKLQAFIYRRIANKEFSKEECVQWLQKMYSDLKAVTRKATRFEEEFFILDNAALPNFYWAKRLGEPQLWLFRKKNDGKYAAVLDTTEKMVKATGGSAYYNDKWQQHTLMVVEKQGAFSLVVIHLPSDGAEPNIKHIPLRGAVSSLYADDGMAKVYYEDQTLDIIIGFGSKIETLFFDRPLRYASIKESFAFVKYQTPPHHFLVRTADKHPFHFSDTLLINDDVSDTYTVASGLAAINVDGEKKYLVLHQLGGQAALVNLPQGYDFDEFSRFNDSFIRFTTKDDDSVFRLLSLKGELRNELFKTEMQLPNSMLLSQIVDDMELFGIYDQDYKEIKPCQYLFKDEYEAYYDENLNLGYRFPTDKNLLFTRPISDAQGKAMGQKMMLLDSETGKVLIPDTWDLIMRIPLQGYSYYKVNDGITVLPDGTWEVKGKYALFDRNGKQLTPFQFDNITYNADSASFICAQAGAKDSIIELGKTRD